MNRELMIKLMNLGGFHRKPSDWDEIGKPITHDLLAELKTYKASDLGIEHHSNILVNFRQCPAEEYFLVERDGGLYLVSTGGSDYARNVRYVGTADDIVKLIGTEHENTIQLEKIGGKWFWWFNEITIVEHIEAHGGLGGPCGTRDEAIKDAVDFCNT